MQMMPNVKSLTYVCPHHYYNYIHKSLFDYFNLFRKEISLNRLEICLDEESAVEYFNNFSKISHNLNVREFELDSTDVIAIDVDERSAAGWSSITLLSFFYIFFFIFSLYSLYSLLVFLWNFLKPGRNLHLLSLGFFLEVKIIETCLIFFVKFHSYGIKFIFSFSRFCIFIFTFFS